MKRLLISLAILPLAGCVAAPLVLAGASLAYTGYGLYSIGHVSNAKYDVEKSEPSAAALAEIRSAKSVAVFPTNSAIDGAVVDIFNERASVPTVSSKKTIGVIERANITETKILSYPAAERAIELKKFGAASGADIVVFATHKDTAVSMNPLLMKQRAIVDINCKVVSAKTGEVLVDEDHSVSFDPRGMPTNEEIAQLVAMGVADRLHEFRTGEKRKLASAKDNAK